MIKKCHLSYESCNYSVYDYSNCGKEKFVHNYLQIEWSSLSDSSISVNEHFNHFHKKTTNCINLHVPKKKVSKNPLKLRSKPWINSYTQRLMDYRHKLFHTMNKTPTPSNKYLYHKFKNHIVSEQCQGKVRYFKNYFEVHKTNMKMLWSGIKSIVNMKAKNELSQISHLLNNGKRIDDPVKMANIFHHYFVNAGSNIDKSIPRTKKSPTDYLKNRNSNSLFLTPVTEQEIVIIIQSLNLSRKAIGPYSIPVSILKILSRHITKPLSTIVNQSFQTGIFPDALKVGKVTPPHKKDSCDNLSNYRPISILSVFSKIIEKLTYDHLYGFLDKFELLYPLQFGFREKHSTTHALLSLTESIKHSIDNHKYGCGITRFCTWAFIAFDICQ